MSSGNLNSFQESKKDNMLAGNLDFLKN